MAEPVRFPEANTQWIGRGDVGPLPAFRDEAQGLSISCWELSAAELREVLDTGKVWLHVWGQHPAVYVTAEQPFEEDRQLTDLTDAEVDESAQIWQRILKRGLTQGRILNAILEERDRQDAKWGDQSHHPDEKWLAILVEEVGEMAKDLLEGKDWRGEAVQAAAVLVAWLEGRQDAKDEA